MTTKIFSSRRAVVALVVVAAGCSVSPPPGAADVREQVAAAERAFARTMATREHAAFAAFLSAEAVFVSGDRPLRGAAEVAAAWRTYFEGPEAPFSWEPEVVEVLSSGKLALTSGPVRNAAGRRTATFTSVWRLESDGRWRIVFDKGNRECPP